MVAEHGLTGTAVVVLAVLVTACAPDAPAVSGLCSLEGFSTTTPPVDDTVVVRGDDPACGVTFETVLVLDGSLDGALPRLPIVAGPGGRWLTGTYEPGRIAVWSADGSLERLIGLGSGDGPGEFDAATDLAVDSIKGTVHVFSNSPRVEVFSLEGDYVESIRLPRPAFGGVLLGDGSIAVSASTSRESRRLLIWSPDSVFAAGPPRRNLVFPPAVRAGLSGAWSSESPVYQIDRHSSPDGDVDLSVRREVDWFPAPSDEGGFEMGGSLLMGFSVSEDLGLVFAQVIVPEPAQGGGGEQPLQLASRPPEGVIEVFTLGGDLVASSRFEDGLAMPNPFSGGTPGTWWYRINDDITRSIEILRPALVPTIDP